MQDAGVQAAQQSTVIQVLDGTTTSCDIGSDDAAVQPWRDIEADTEGTEPSLPPLDVMYVDSSDDGCGVAEPLELESAQAPR